jgi:RUN domain-containing protein 1
LQIVGGFAITPKQTLLSTIDEIVQSHTPLKRSPDSHFKALVCEGLNQGKLVTWLKLVLKTRPLVEACYEDWSYVATCSAEDAVRSLDRLTNIKFNLATDVAIRQLRNINDAF